MSASLKVLYSLLDDLKGPTMAPREVREGVEEWTGDRTLSKQSVTNAARRLAEAGLIDRTEGYAVNYGYLIAVLLHSIIDLTDRIAELEDELVSLKRALRK